MSHLEDLIAELCPDGVPFRQVRDIAIVGTGSSDRKDAVLDGEFPLYVRSREVLRAKKHEFDEQAVLIPGEGGIGDIFHYVDGKYALHQRAYRIAFTDPRVDTRFAFYFLKARFKQFILGQAVSATVTSIRKPMIERFEVPVPPAAVQREIVRILDTMETLEAELEAELEARRKQYEHYRNSLLDFAEAPPAWNVRWTTLGEISSNLDSQRKPVTKGQRLAGAIPYYGASGVVDFVAEHIFDGDYLLVSEDGANLVARSTPIAFSISGKSWVNNHAHVLEFRDYVSRRFVEIYLNSIDLSPYLSGGAQPKLNKANMNRIPIPDPSDTRKAEVVDLLDKFDALVNDISIGLPAEIEARRKQYEYYRDKLLTFKEVA